MKSSLAIVSSLALLAVAAAPADEPTDAKKPRIEVCFVLDTTGSMSGLIGYRDRGDEYVTKVTDLTDDIDGTLLGYGRREQQDKVAAKQAASEAAAAGKGDAFDEEVAKTVREQAARKGIRSGE